MPADNERDDDVPERCLQGRRHRVRTLKSPTRAWRFIVEAGGLKIYPAGDLNWWTGGRARRRKQSNGKSVQSRNRLAQGRTFDIAFVPVDPRLENEYLWGLDYF
jgi:hypothetical protein